MYPQSWYAIQIIPPQYFGSLVQILFSQYYLPSDATSGGASVPDPSAEPSPDPSVFFVTTAGVNAWTSWISTVELNGITN